MRANLGKVFELFVLCASVLVVVACGGGGNSSNSSNSSSKGGSSTPLSGDVLFTAATSTINVAVVSDVARTASQVVTSAGATISAVAADGSQFTLVIPASAVTQPTAISMTPLVSVSGVPFASGVMAAVQFEPDGLALDQDAILTIVPAVNVPVQNQTPIGYLGAGNDLHIAPMVVPASPATAIQLRISHFSGVGLASGTAAERASLMLRRAADHQARLEQEIAWYLLMTRQNSLLNTSDQPAVLPTLMNYLDSYYGLVVRPRILAASASCANAKLAYKTFYPFQRDYSMYNGGQPHPSYMQDLGTIDSAYNSLACVLANRYTGTFTYSEPGGVQSVTGSVTYVRDDAAGVGAGLGGIFPKTVFYRVESVSYTATPTEPGVTYSPSTMQFQLVNTPMVDSHLLIDITAAAPPYNYIIKGFWDPLILVTATMGPPNPPFQRYFPGWASIASGNNVNTDGKAINGSNTWLWTSAGGASLTKNSTWSLTAAP